MFHPKFRYGFIQESETGMDVHFRMDQCFKFECLDESGPVFSDEYKDQWPKKGEMVIFILDTEPVLPGMRPSALKWNFAKSFKECLEAYSNEGSDTRKSVPPPQQKAWSRQGQHHNSPRRTSGHDEANGLPYLPECARGPKSPAPNINLASEFRISDMSLEKLARSVGGKNAHTRQHHRAARTQQVH